MNTKSKNKPNITVQWAEQPSAERLANFALTLERVLNDRLANGEMQLPAPKPITPEGFRFAGTDYVLAETEDWQLEWLADVLTNACANITQQAENGSLDDEQYERVCAKYVPMRDAVFAEQKRRKSKAA